MYAGKMFKATTEARVVLKMMQDVFRASHSLASAFGGENYLSNAEIIEVAQENTQDSHCHNFFYLAEGDGFNRYQTGGGTRLEWRVWNEGRGKWYAEAHIEHPTGVFTPESTLLYSCELAGFLCEDLRSNREFHYYHAMAKRLSEAARDFVSVSADDIAAPYYSGANKERFLTTLRAWIANCELRMSEDTDNEYIVWADEPSAEELLGESTLAKLRARMLDFDN